MTTTKIPPVRPVPAPVSDPPSPRRPRLQLSATQLAASALAAVTATVAASYLGVSGTVIGAAVASVVTVVGNAVYSHSIRRTSQRVRTAVPIASRWTPEDDSPPTLVLPTVLPPATPRRGRLRDWQRAALASAGVFVVLLAAVTSVELALGRPLSDALRGKAAHGTSLSNTTGGGRPAPAPAPSTRTVTVTPSVVVVTPTITRTAPPVTATRTPTAASTGTPTPTSATSAPATGKPSAVAPSTPAPSTPGPNSAIAPTGTSTP